MVLVMPPRKRDGMIVGLCGAARAGKDSVADVLTLEHGFVRFAFADELRLILMEINPTIDCGNGVWKPLQTVIETLGWDFAKTHGGRELLQNLGASMRQRDPEFWIKIVQKQMGRDWSRNMVVTDARHLNEIKMIRDVGGEMWEIVRPGVGPINDHVSEHEWRQATFEKVLKNDGNLSDLLVRVADALQQDQGDGDERSNGSSTQGRRTADEPRRARTSGGVR
jgi:hypothetical protein